MLLLLFLNEIAEFKTKKEAIEKKNLGETERERRQSNFCFLNVKEKWSRSSDNFLCIVTAHHASPASWFTHNDHLRYVNRKCLLNNAVLAYFTRNRSDNVTGHFYRPVIQKQLVYDPQGHRELGPTDLFMKSPFLSIIINLQVVLKGSCIISFSDDYCFLCKISYANPSHKCKDYITSENIFWQDKQF